MPLLRLSYNLRTACAFWPVTIQSDAILKRYNGGSEVQHKLYLLCKREEGTTSLTARLSSKLTSAMRNVRNQKNIWC